VHVIVVVVVDGDGPEPLPTTKKTQMLSSFGPSRPPSLHIPRLSPGAPPLLPHALTLANGSYADPSPRSTTVLYPPSTLHGPDTAPA
jgi:hypothetical protein